LTASVGATSTRSSAGSVTTTGEPSNPNPTSTDPSGSSRGISPSDSSLSSSSISPSYTNSPSSPSALSSPSSSSSSSASSNLSVGTIVGIVVGTITIIALLLLTSWLCYRRGQRQGVIRQQLLAHDSTPSSSANPPPTLGVAQEHKSPAYTSQIPVQASQMYRNDHSTSEIDSRVVKGDRVELGVQ
jgi:hypothetical protein